MTRHLYLRFPHLSNALPYLPFADLPTPIDPAHHLGTRVGVERLYIKRDDLSGQLYGGNKIRKLEFLLGQARHAGKREVLTFGYAGSNHALATAICAADAGMRSISMLLPQANSHSLQRNLLRSHHAGAELHHYANRPLLSAGLAYQLLRHRVSQGTTPLVIPPGGSSPVGIMGIVNAVLELDAQIREGIMPAPDRIYVAVGSMGTTAGLLIGLALTGLQCRVIPVRVIDSRLANPGALKQLLNRTTSFLRAAGVETPAIPEEACELREGFFGQEYAVYTDQGAEAMRLLEECNGIRLDGTYSAKAFAALLADARRGELAGQTVLYWNTYNSRPFWETMPQIDYHQLPRTLHRYFEGPVQPLDT